MEGRAATAAYGNIAESAGKSSLGDLARAVTPRSVSSSRAPVEHGRLNPGDAAIASRRGMKPSAEVIDGSLQKTAGSAHLLPQETGNVVAKGKCRLEPVTRQFNARTACALAANFRVADYYRPLGRNRVNPLA